MNNENIYVTGFTVEDKPLIGGLWRMHRQEGFPIDIGILTCKENDMIPDWMDILAEAGAHNEWPSLDSQIEIPMMAKFLFYREYERRKNNRELDVVCAEMLEEKRSKAADITKITTSLKGLISLCESITK